MKPIRTFIILLILAPVLSSVPTIERRPARAAKPQVATAPTTTGIVEPLNTPNSTDATEPLPPQSPVSSWHIETVDSVEVAGLSTSLALDGSGQPHISYCYENWSYWGEDTGALKYAWYNGMTWQIETVNIEKGIGLDTSLALDESDRPHINYCYGKWSYWGEGYKFVKYTWPDGTAWQIETVDSMSLGYCFIPEGCSIDCDASLALEGSGRPHISYTDESNGDLKYAWHDGTDWHIETVDSEGRVGTYISLAMDGSDRPYISYYVGTNDDLKYAWHNGTSWHVETVDSEGWVGWYTSLALDGSNQPHISYYDWGNGNLKYAWHDGTGWHIETVDSEGQVGWYTSLALDGLDRPHIAYYDGTNDDLKYTWHDGTGWHIETVDSEGGLYTSLTLDGTGWPHISYYDATNGDLKYARLMPPLLLLNKQATPSDGLRNSDTLTYTLTLSGPGLSVRLWDPLPTAVHYITDSITGSVTPPAVYSPATRAVVWQGTLPTDTAQVIRFRVTPSITGTGSLSLSLPIVNTTWMTDTHSGASISVTVIVNGQRIYLPLILR